MRSPTIDEHFLRFVEDPTFETYLSVRERIVEDPRYDPYSDELRQLELDFQAADFPRVHDTAPRLQPIWNLSPRFHYISGVSALEMGDVEAADYERKLSRACLYGLTETGDGSSERPFRVTYLSDEYDLMRCMDVEIQQQQVVDAGDGQLDVLRDSEGHEYWFDVTEVMSAVRRRPANENLGRRQRPIVRQA